MKNINENQKITLTIGQLKRLVRESHKDDWHYQVLCGPDPEDPNTSVRVARFDNYEDANKLALMLEKTVVAVPSHFGTVASFWVADETGYLSSGDEDEM